MQSSSSIYLSKVIVYILLLL